MERLSEICLRYKMLSVIYNTPNLSFCANLKKSKLNTFPKPVENLPDSQVE